jgi:NAD(P)-dependent dehydrogenase (short-subunit alcohol dehydrogenase family)
VENLRIKGAEALYVKIDVTDYSSVSAALAAVVEKYGRLDFAVNSAAIPSDHAAVAEVDPALWRRLFAINVEGVFLSMKAVLSHMLQQDSGCIVNMASGAGLTAVPYMAPYCASKHAVLGLTKSAALEYVDRGIRINAVCPAAVETPMLLGLDIDEEQRQAIDALHPIGRMAKPDEVASMILFVCSEEAQYATGVEFRLNGGSGI